MNPELVHVTRGATVESRHSGAIAICKSDGTCLAGLGDVARPVFPRSAIKLMQATLVVTSGAADRFGFDTRALAVACASHRGTPDHVRVVSDMLQAVGVGQDDLACGAHWPFHDASRNELARGGGAPNRLHNNCSGKHAAILAACVASGWPVEGYTALGHPAQYALRCVLENLCQTDLADSVPGQDGCGLPNWPLSLTSLAVGFARLNADRAPDGPATDARLATLRDAATRLRAACWAHPELPGGPGMLDTEVLRLGAGCVYIKTGAEGAYCGAMPKLGLGFAIKVDDGAARASEAIVLELLAALDDQYHLERFGELRRRRSIIRNWAGDPVGRILATGALVEFTRGLSLVGH